MHGLAELGGGCLLFFFINVKSNLVKPNLDVPFIRKIQVAFGFSTGLESDLGDVRIKSSSIKLIVI